MTTTYVDRYSEMLTFQTNLEYELEKLVYSIFGIKVDYVSVDPCDWDGVSLELGFPRDFNLSTFNPTPEMLQKVWNEGFTAICCHTKEVGRQQRQRFVKE